MTEKNLDAWMRARHRVERENAPATGCEWCGATEEDGKHTSWAAPADCSCVPPWYLEPAWHCPKCGHVFQAVTTRPRPGRV